MPGEEEEEADGRTSHSTFTSCSPFMLANRPPEAFRVGEQFRGPQAVPYWSRRNDTILVGIVDEHSFTRECITGFLQKLHDTVEIMSFSSYEECVQSARHHDLIVYHAHQEMKNDIIDDECFVKIKSLIKIAPVIILSSVDCHNVMVKAFESGVRGFILTASTTPMQVIEIIRLVKAGGLFVPPSSLFLQRVNRSRLTPTAIATDQLTPRELAVLQRLTLGKANKTIAYELQMSESTVKVHIRSIMNKLNARNRTEVVSRAYDLGGLEMR